MGRAGAVNRPLTLAIGVALGAGLFAGWPRVLHAVESSVGTAGVRILLLSDSCHSGSVTRGKEDDLDPGQPRARFWPAH